MERVNSNLRFEDKLEEKRVAQTHSFDYSFIFFMTNIEKKKENPTYEC